MDEAEVVPRTTLVFYRVPAGHDAPRDYEAVYLRSQYHGARPGTDATPQTTYHGYVSRIEPGSGLTHVLDVREPHATQEEVEGAALTFLAERHHVGLDRIEVRERLEF